MVQRSTGYKFTFQSPLGKNDFKQKVKENPQKYKTFEDFCCIILFINTTGEYQMAKNFVGRTHLLQDARIAGIPCLIDATSKMHTDSGIEISFVVYDTKGYKADWLSKKMTDKDIETINDIIEQSSYGVFDPLY